MLTNSRLAGFTFKLVLSCKLARVHKIPYIYLLNTYLLLMNFKRLRFTFKLVLGCKLARAHDKPYLLNTYLKGAMTSVSRIDMPAIDQTRSQ